MAADDKDLFVLLVETVVELRGQVAALETAVYGPEPASPPRRDRHGMRLVKAPEDSPAGRALAPGATTPAGVYLNRTEGRRPR